MNLLFKPRDENQEAEYMERTTDAEFVLDCWRYLQAIDPRWARHTRAEQSALENELIMTVAYERLSRARACGDDTNHTAEIVFHVPLREVSNETWNLFVRRTRPIARFF